MNAPARIALPEDGTSPAEPTASSGDHLVALSVLGGAAVYATVRYNLFKGVPWSDWPGYIADKALAVAGLLLLALAVWRRVRGSGGSRTLMAWAGVLVIGHALLSLALFPGGHFPKLLSEGKITPIGGLSLLTGALAVGLLELGARQAPNWTPSGTRTGLAALLVLGAVHTAAPGLAGWFEPGTWPGGLPPLTVIAAVPALAVAVLAMKSFQTAGRGKAFIRLRQ